MDRKKPPLRHWIWKAYLWATERLYHQLAWAYDAVAWLVSFGHWSEWRRTALVYLKSGSVLETGFGTGALLLEMLQSGRDVVGLELSPAMHRVASRRFIKAGVEPQQIRARTEVIPFCDACFDNIIATFPTTYVAQAATLAEYYRVLPSNGRVVIIGLGVRFHSPLLRWLTGWFLEDSSGSMIRFFSEQAAEAGFNVNTCQHDDNGYILLVLILEKDDAGYITGSGKISGQGHMRSW